MPAEAAYALGDRVRIVDLGKPGHVRTPTYARGKVGVIDHCCGRFENPEERAYGRVGGERITRAPTATRSCWRSTITGCGPPDRWRRKPYQ